MVQLTKKNSGVSVMSSCPYHYMSMSYNSAKTVSKATPCTNMPIHCPLCPPGRSGQLRTIWKYNTLFHLLKEHTDEHRNPPPILMQLAVDMHISFDEEDQMNIDHNVTEDWRVKHKIPGSDEIAEHRKTIASSQDKKGKKCM